MSRLLTTTADVISALGGTGKVARILGKNQTTVCNWITRKKFPPETFLVFQEILKEHRLSAPPDLWGMVVPRRPKAQATPESRVA